MITFFISGCLKLLSSWHYELSKDIIIVHACIETSKINSSQLYKFRFSGTEEPLPLGYNFSRFSKRRGCGSELLFVNLNRLSSIVSFSGLLRVVNVYSSAEIFRSEDPANCWLSSLLGGGGGAALPAL